MGKIRHLQFTSLLDSSLLITCRNNMQAVQSTTVIITGSGSSVLSYPVHRFPCCTGRQQPPAPVPLMDQSPDQRVSLPRSSSQLNNIAEAQQSVPFHKKVKRNPCYLKDNEQVQIQKEMLLYRTHLPCETRCHRLRSRQTVWKNF